MSATVIDRIMKKGDEVFRHEWDSGGMGGAGVELVYELNNKYAFSSNDFGRDGPYDSLEAALEAHGLLTVTDATTQICYWGFAPEEVAALLTATCNEGYVFNIDDEEWVYLGKSKGRGKKRKDLFARYVEEEVA